MFDFLGIRIFFKDSFLAHTMKGDVVESAVCLKECSIRGLNVVARELEFEIQDNGLRAPVISDLTHPWESLPSSYTGIAFKVYQASGFRPAACVELKASPAKIAQGHNVYGSDDLFTGANYILNALKSALPEFSEMLDFRNVDVFRFDATYSLQLESKDQLMSVLDSLTRVSNRYLRPSRDGDFETTIYFNNVRGNPNTGRTTSLCIYSKLDEVIHQHDELCKRKKKEKTSRYDKVIEELSSPRLHGFAENRLRFEGRLCARWFKKQNIPQNLWELLDYIKAFESESDLSFCQWAWGDAMKDLLDAVSGQTITVMHDHKIRKLLHKEFDTVDAKGKVKKAKALRLFAVYDRLKYSGYKKVKHTMTNGTFYRAISDLMLIGLAKAELQNLNRKERFPLCNLIQFDFENQTPDYYQSPELGQTNTPTKLLAHLTGENILDTSALDFDPRQIVEDRLESIGMLPLYATALQKGKEVRLSQDVSLSFMVWPDGDCDLIYHKPGNKQDRFGIADGSPVNLPLSPH